jgi:hypothetical protein
MTTSFSELADLDNYKDILESGKQSVLVEFYAPWYVYQISSVAFYEMNG